MEKAKVLLVDDNIDMLLIGQRIFNRAGYNFISARTGQEGLSKVVAEKPDVIILDYILPDINGTQFVKSLAEEPEYSEVKDTPIVVLTARTSYIEDLETCFKLGMKAFLNKPFGHRELVNVVENIIKLSKIEKKAEQQKEKEQSDKAPPMPDSREVIDPVWFEDLKIAAGTVASLCRELVDNEKENKNLTDQQKMDIQAVYRSSQKLLKLINEKSVRNVSDEDFFLA